MAMRNSPEMVIHLCNRNSEARLPLRMESLKQLQLKIPRVSQLNSNSSCLISMLKLKKIDLLSRMRRGRWSEFLRVSSMIKKINQIHLKIKSTVLMQGVLEQKR